MKTVHFAQCLPFFLGSDISMDCELLLYYYLIDQCPPAYMYTGSQAKAQMVKTSMERKVGRKKKEKLRKDGKVQERC